MRDRYLCGQPEMDGDHLVQPVAFGGIFVPVLHEVNVTFPALTTPWIVRDNVLDTLEHLLESHPVVEVTGRAGVGKTTLLVQFVRRHPTRTVSLFIRGASRFQYDLDRIRDSLTAQISLAVWGLVPEASDTTESANLFPRLERLAQREGKSYYVIVDGLSEIPLEDSLSYREAIISLLPIGSRWLRCAISGSISSLIPERLRRKVPYSSLPLSALSKSETTEFLDGTGLTKAKVEAVFQSTKGRPEHLKYLRAKLLADDMPDSNITSGLEELFALDWEKVKGEEQTLEILSVLIFGAGTDTSDSIAAILQRETSDVSAVISSLPFLDTDPAGRIEFTSAQCRAAFAEELASRKGQVDDLMAADLFSRDPANERVMTYLPGYLRGSGDYERLLEYLSPALFVEILRRYHSYSWVRQMSVIAAQAAADAHKHGDVVRFVLQQIAFDTAEGMGLMRAQVEALGACGRLDEALALADEATVVEEQLYVLAIVARLQHESLLSPDPVLLDRISRLYEQVEMSTVAQDKGVRLVEELIPTLPSLALRLVERLEQRATLPQRDDLHAEPTSTPDGVAGTGSRVFRPSIATRLAQAVALPLSRYDQGRVLNEAAGMESVGQKVFMLTHWISKNASKSDCSSVAQRCLEIMSTESGYAPNATDVLRVARCLGTVRTVEAQRILSQGISLLLPDLEATGPTQDYVAVVGELSLASRNWDSSEAMRLATEAVAYIEEIGDLVVRMSSAAQLLSTISSESDMQPLISALRDRIVTDALQAVDGTAEHLQTFEGVLSALARCGDGLATEIVEMFNTQSRREEAYVLIANELMLVGAEDPQRRGRYWDDAYGLQERITYPHLRHEVVTTALEQMAISEGTNIDAVQVAGSWINLIPVDVVSPQSRCQAYSEALRFLAGCGEGVSSSLGAGLEATLYATWEQLDSAWERAWIGYLLARDLEPVLHDLADAYLARANNLRSGLLAGKSGFSSLVSVVRLAVRAFGGLKSEDSDDDLRRIDALITSIPDAPIRALLWRDLAAECHTSGRADLCTRVVTRHIDPPLLALPDSKDKRRLVRAVLPMQYCVRPAATMEMIDGWPGEFERDLACESILDHLLWNLLPGHGVTMDDVIGSRIRCDESKLQDALAILSHVSKDALLYHYVHQIANVATARSTTLTRAQKLAMADQIRTLSQKLPNPRHIAHPGYRILLEVEASRLMPDNRRQWQGMVNEAMKIGNTSDRAYVLILIAEQITSQNEQRQVLEQAAQECDGIVDVLDKAGRLEELARVWHPADSRKAHELLSSALLQASGGKEGTLMGRDSWEAQKSVIDTAHRLDPSLGATLASKANSDPARQYARRRNEERELSDRISRDDEAILSANPDVVPHVFYTLLSGLESGQTSTVDLKTSDHHLLAAGNLDLPRAFPVIAWAVENAKRRTSAPRGIAETVRPIFESLLFVAELLRQSNQLRDLPRKVPSGSRDNLDRSIFNPGERAQALAYVKTWLEDGHKDWITITDPYFDLEALEAVALIESVNAHCNISVLTSLGHLRSRHATDPAQWHDRWLSIANHQPPQTHIVAVSDSRGRFPIHDRWWTAEQSALWMGTSFTGLGLKLSRINRVTGDELTQAKEVQRRYLQSEIWETDGDRIEYLNFSLS